MPKNQGMNFPFVKEVFLCKGVLLPPLPVPGRKAQHTTLYTRPGTEMSLHKQPLFTIRFPGLFLTHFPTIHLLEAQTPLFF